jgi:lipoyl(octanoyl) transferase
MAVDHALFEGVQAGGQPVLRLYRWQPACLSFGRNQHARGVYDAARLAAAQLDAVRRPTGGLAVLHDRELTYCVLVPESELGGPRETYHRLNLALVEAMRGLGVAAGLAEAGRVRDPRGHSAEPCFQSPANGEVVVAGRKLIGSAQRRERHTLLQHGSILLDGTQRDVLGLLLDSGDTAGTGGGPQGAGAVAAVAAGATTLRELLGRVPTAGHVADAVARGIERVCGIRLAPATLTDAESARAAELATFYGNAGWTWRR